MKFRKSIWLTVMALLAVTLSACTLGSTPAPTQDTSAIQTQALELVLTQSAMQQTQTAMADSSLTITLPNLSTFPPLPHREASPHSRLLAARRNRHTLCIQYTFGWLHPAGFARPHLRRYLSQTGVHPGCNRSRWNCLQTWRGFQKNLAGDQFRHM